MNIFATSLSPAESAAALDDSRVIKMAHDVTQLCSIIAEAYGAPQLYKVTNIDDSMRFYIDWGGKSVENLAWLVDYALNCYREHYKRTGHAHKNGNVLIFIAGWMKEHGKLPEGEAQLPPPWQMPNEVDLNVITQFNRDDLNFRWAAQPREPKWYGETRPEITALREA